MNNVKIVFSLMPYLVYSEIYVRSHTFLVPYLFVEYILIGVFLLLLLRQAPFLFFHSRAFIFIVFFALVEIINSLRTEDPEYARVLIINTTLLAIASVWASSNILSNRLINIFLANVKFAGIYLCGIILVAHFTGNINYKLESSVESTNLLAPVQISGYLGVVCVLFFLSLTNDDERPNIFLNAGLFCISLTLMILSFSRGGLYFVAIIMGLYFLFNWKKSGNFLFALFLIPIAYIIYDYVVSATNGLIIERYQEPGTSGRDELIKAGFKLFKENPFTGVGTGNFLTEVASQHLYLMEAGAHNEFVRAAAEHGILGLSTYFMFYIVLFIGILKRKKIQREYGIYFLVLFCLILVHNALKISIQPLLIMLAIATPSPVIVKEKKRVSFMPQQAV